MKKVLVTLLLAVAALSANAVPLFANFVDLCPKWTELQQGETVLMTGIPSPRDMKANLELLGDGNGGPTKILNLGSEEYPVVVYLTPMSIFDDFTADGRVSALYLVSRPTGYVVYYSESTPEQQLLFQQDMLAGKI